MTMLLRPTADNVLSVSLFILAKTARIFKVISAMIRGCVG